MTTQTLPRSTKTEETYTWCLVGAGITGDLLAYYKANNPKWIDDIQDKDTYAIPAVIFGGTDVSKDAARMCDGTLFSSRTHLATTVGTASNPTALMSLTHEELFALK